MVNKRFTEPWYTSDYFSKRVLVQCPSCKAEAVVTGESKYFFPFIPTHVECYCSHCGYFKTMDDKIWQGSVLATGRTICTTCGHKWLEYTERRSKPPTILSQTGRVSCETCNTETEIPITWHKQIFKGDAKDPYLGFDLLLQKRVKGHLFWAYNFDHLNYLETYLSSTLRERGKNAGKYSIITNLPHWVKNAKNRDALLKAIKTMRDR